MNDHDLTRGPAWVYRIYDTQGRLIYVGETLNLVVRLAAHGDKWWGTQIAKVKAKVYPNRGEAQAAERAAIKAERPRFNIKHRDASPLARRSWTAEDYDDYLAARSRRPDGSESGQMPGLIARLRAERARRYGDPTERTA